MRFLTKTSGWCLPMLVLALASTAQAQTHESLDLDPVESALDERIEAFFKNVNLPAVTVRQALDDLLVDGPLAASDDRATLVEEIEQITDRYGAMLAAELIDAQRVGDDVILLKYLYKCEDYPLVWRFSFYRRPSLEGMSENGMWNVIGVRFDTQIEPEGF